MTKPTPENRITKQTFSIDGAALQRARMNSYPELKDMAVRVTMSIAQLQQLERSTRSDLHMTGPATPDFSRRFPAFYGPAHVIIAARRYARVLGLDHVDVIRFDASGDRTASPEPVSTPPSATPPGTAAPANASDPAVGDKYASRRTPPARPLRSLRGSIALRATALGLLAIVIVAIATSPSEGILNKRVPPAQLVNAGYPLPGSTDANDMPDKGPGNHILAMHDMQSESSDLPPQSGPMPDDCRANDPGEPADYSHPRPLRPGNYVYLRAGMSPTSLCVTDALGQVTKVLLKPGEGRRVYGVPPLALSGIQASDMQAYYQGRLLPVSPTRSSIRLSPTDRHDGS